MRKLLLLLLLTILAADSYADERKYDIIVAADGSGDYTSVQEAIDAVPVFRKSSRTTIFVRKGTYKERVIIAECKINIAMIGEEGTVITYDGYAEKDNGMGEGMSTSGSATVYIYGTSFYAENITFENSAGPVGQAVACFVSADKVSFRNCRFLGFQDTLYTYGAGMRQYYEDCYIEGTVDFIFGWSNCVFNRCEIHSKAPGYVTAPSTPEGSDYGYLFYQCRLTAAPGVSNVYLSRPWRPHAQCVYLNCWMDRHIAPAGWDNWGKSANEKTAYYAECGSTGPGAAPKQRVAWSHQLPDASAFNIPSLLAADDDWCPIGCMPALVSKRR